jgi:hypothetical protein
MGIVEEVLHVQGKFSNLHSHYGVPGIQHWSYRPLLPSQDRELEPRAYGYYEAI